MSSLTLSATVNASPSVSANGSSTNISSASSDSSGGSNSETTVISDGGFTDYLSDESEQELQRQAEVRAELLTQNHFEELEFKKARQQLVQVDLRPPKSWTGSGSGSGSGSGGGSVGGGSAGSGVSVASAGSAGERGSPRSQAGGNTTPPYSSGGAALSQVRS